MRLLPPINILLPIVAIVVGSVYASQRYLQSQLEKDDDPSYRYEIADALTSHTLLKIYLDRLRRALDWLDDPNRMGPLNTLSGAFQSFNVCLAMSAAYTVFSLIVGWMFGGPGSIGETHFLPPHHNRMIQFGLGAVLLVFSVVVSLGLIRGKDIDARCETWLVRHLTPYGVTENLAKWPYRLGGASVTGILWLTTAFYSDFSGPIIVGVFVAGATGVVSAGAGTVAGPMAIALAATGGGAIGGIVTAAILTVFIFSLGGAVVLPGAGVAIFTAVLPLAFLVGAALILVGAGAVAVTITLMGAVAVAGVISAIACKGNGFLAGSITGAIGGGAAAGGTIATAGVTGHLENPFAVALLLFPVILPVINALVDWASWYVSRKLGRHLLTVIDGPLARGLKFLWLIGHIIADLAVAIGLLYLLAVALPFTIELFNLWCRGAGQAEPLPLSTFLHRIIQHPLRDGIWALSMLLSTLVPTAIHSVILTASPFMIWLYSDKQREGIAIELLTERPKKSAIRKASWRLPLAWHIGILATIILAYAFVYHPINALWRPISGLLIEATYHGMAGANQIAYWLGWPSP